MTATDSQRRNGPMAPTSLDTRAALCLAAATYCGWSWPGLDVLQEHTVQGRLTSILGRLHELAPEVGSWRIAWGPACYRTPGSFLDDVVVCLLREPSRPHRLVVAVRGTNPGSVLDWVLGDFWVGAKVAWPFGTGEAAVSASTALGLGIARQLRAAPRPAERPPLAEIFDPLLRVSRELGGAALRLLQPLGERLSAALGHARGRIHTDYDTLVRSLRDLTGLPPDVKVARLAALWGAGLAAVTSEPDPITDLARAIEDSARTIGDRAAFELLRLLEGNARIAERLEGGVTLVDALRAETEAGEDVEVVVTGHSKGGALAVALATWLADTQGDQVAEAFRWDPHRRAAVHCVSFAAPTAGNAAFARHATEVLRGTNLRVVNPFDVVPHAWVPADIRRLAHLYESARLPGLDVLADAIATRLTRHGYTHAGSEQLVQTSEKPGLTFVEQMVYQHLGAYLEGLGLPNAVSVVLFFGPPDDSAVAAPS